MSGTPPKVSVVMAVHNGMPYLDRAIQSILAQTFEDYEFIIIDDGSTDGTAAILNHYAQTHHRVRVYHQQHLGLIVSLNRGCNLARGDYIARMDADDVSVPERLAKQVAFLERQPSCCVVAAKILLIDDHGNPVGVWPEDMNTSTWSAIRHQLPRSNCIAHPTVMLRTCIIREYPYSEKQLHSEDYDLWLRLCSDGRKIDKISEILVQYRIHPFSVSSITNQQTGVEWLTIRTKVFFLWHKASRMRVNTFDATVLGHLVGDLVTFGTRRIRGAISSPLNRALRYLTSVMNTP